MNHLPNMRNGTPLVATLVATFVIALVANVAAQPPGIEKSPARRQGSATAAATFTRQITFSGYNWLVKDGFAGPGPNYFSDSPRNVWVDSQGRLHLKIERRRGRWYTAEVMLTEALGHGTYRWEIESPVDDLDPNVVLGLFTWCDDGQFNCEVDIEFSRWGNASNPWNAGYVVQPYHLPDHVIEFYFPEASPSTHSFTWKPPTETTFGSVQFESWTSDDPSQPPYVTSTYVGEVPPADGTHARINLWLQGGNKPQRKKTKSIEVVISSFSWEPLP